MRTPTQLEKVKEAMHQAKDRRMFERYQAVYLHLSGYKQYQIAQILDRHAETVGIYVSKYEENGLAGLALGHSTGKPPKLTLEQKAKLVETVSTRVSADVGLTTRYNWTLALIAEFVQNEWAVSYSLRGMSSLVHQVGLSYTRPTYTMEKADPEKQRVFAEEIFPQLKKIIE